MSNVPAELKYSKEHEWLRKEADGTYTVGITEHAQELLGDMVFVDLPEVGATVEAGADCAVAESVKAASDIYAPISGEIVAVNEELNDSPELVNSDPYTNGWIFKSKPATKRRLPRCWMPPRMKLYWKTNKYASSFTLQGRWLPGSPRSLTFVSSRGVAVSPPSCNANDFAYSGPVSISACRANQSDNHDSPHVSGTIAHDSDFKSA